MQGVGHLHVAKGRGCQGIQAPTKLDDISPLHCPREKEPTRDVGAAHQFGEVLRRTQGRLALSIAAHSVLSTTSQLSCLAIMLIGPNCAILQGGDSSGTRRVPAWPEGTVSGNPECRSGLEPLSDHPENGWKPR
jgi:hypothetical protein